MQSLLCHIRKAHNGEDLLEESVSHLRLSRSSYCQNWFQNLSQHVSQCKKHSVIANGPISSHQLPSSSSQCHLVASTPTQGNAHTATSSSAPLPRNDRQTPASDNLPYHQSSGWQFIMGLSTNDILKVTPPQTVRSIKPKLKTQFLDCCFNPLQESEKTPWTKGPERFYCYYPE